MDGYLRAEISVSAVHTNIALVRSLLSPGVKICGVVKANAYGHGLRQVLGVVGSMADMLGVAICSEAVVLRQLGWQRPVIMFTTACASNAADLAELIAHDVTLTLTSMDELLLLQEATQIAHRNVNVHVKVDTGMTRSGVLPERAAELVAAARAADFAHLQGMYTHFACADDADKSATREQLRRFLASVDACGGRGGLVLHAANSAAAVDMPDTHLDMIRPGMVMYGYQPGQSIHNHLPLQPCLRLMAPIVQIKDVPAGAATGYGLTYRFDHDARVALVPIGYADGYFRSLSNRAVMQVGGINCPIRGRISMDQTIIEVTHVPDVHIGQMADIISNDPDAPNSVDSLAEMANTIPYEIVPRLGDRITRVVVS